MCQSNPALQPEAILNSSIIEAPHLPTETGYQHCPHLFDVQNIQDNLVVSFCCEHAGEFGLESGHVKDFNGSCFCAHPHHVADCTHAGNLIMRTVATEHLSIHKYLYHSVYHVHNVCT